MERLAAQAGLPMPAVDRETVARDKARASLHDVMAMAVGYFEQQLQSAGGANARAYLRQRGVSPKAQIAFHIGYAPDSRNGLKEFLAAKGVAPAQLEACGLVVHSEDIPVSYDRFRDRIMFPIEDLRGRNIAFGGRALDPAATAKYLNSPETELFVKSRVLYNHARARRAAHEAETVIAVEGYLDVIALVMAGIENCVAPLGTALTETQLEMLWRMASEPVLCFDGDDAGTKAAYRAIDLALPNLTAGRSLRFALLPKGRDPDDLVREEGADAIRAVIRAALPLSEMLWRRETASASLDTPEQKAALEARLRIVGASIRDESLRRHYTQDFAERMRSNFGAQQDFRKLGAPHGKPALGFRASDRRVAPSPSLLNSALVRRNSSAVPLRDAVLVATMAHHPAILMEYFEEFSRLALASTTAQRLRQSILEIYGEWETHGRDGDRTKLREALSTRGLTGALDDMDRQLRENRIWQALPEAALEDALEGWRQALSLHLRSHQLMRELRAAEIALADEESEENFDRLVEIRAEFARAEGVEALVDGFGMPSGRPMRRF